MRKLLFLVLALSLPCFVPDASAASETSPRPLVVCSTTILADMARQMSGARLDVRSLVPPGIDPHHFQPSPDDVRLVASARLVVVNGLGYEGWLDKLISAAGIMPERVVIASRGIDSMTAGTHQHTEHQHQSEQDPHAWHDVKNGMHYVTTMRDSFIAIDAAGSADYIAWSELYQAQLRVMDAWVRKQVATIPSEQRIIVTSHDALSYFARAYGFQVISVAGITTGQEPDAARFSALIEQLRTKKVAAVFIEQSANPRLVERLGQEAGARLGASLFTDSLAPSGEFGATYEEMFQHNTRAIVRGLTGQ
jgi:zinc/manganese transport system substrate-binding protein